MLTREIKFTPAFDKRSPDPKENYGTHGVEMTWYLVGPEGAVQFKVYTDWHLPHVREEHRLSLQNRDLFPMAVDLGYHSHKPMYEGQEPLSCTVLKGTCYYDGSTWAALPVLDLLVKEGGEAVWQYLEKYYHKTFSTNEEPQCS